MKLFWFVCFAMLSITMSLAAFDATATDWPNEIPLSKLTCNAQTLIDFSFGSTMSASKLNFLDKDGVQHQLNLSEYSVKDANPGFILSQTFTETGNIVFKFLDNTTKTVYVYIATTASSLPSSNLLIDTTSNKSILQGLQAAIAAPTFTYFNFLNKLDYSQFYTVVATSGQIILVNRFLYKVKTLPTATMANLNSVLNALTLNKTTGSLLCFGSASLGVFQTHLRESYPLWTAIISCFLFWLYYLISEANYIQCYDKRFQNNNMTCWSLYSLYHLAHEEYFPKLLRLVNFYVAFLIRGVFLAAMYSTQYASGSPSIIWTAVVAWAAALPFPFLFGNLFIKKFYKHTLHKYEVIGKMKGVFNKDSVKQLQAEADKDLQQLFGTSYMQNVLAFCFTAVAITMSINLMQQLPRVFYYIHYYWLASMGVSLGLQVLVYEPLCAYFFGHTNFFRSRGYFYNFQLGENYKQMQD